MYRRTTTLAMLLGLAVLVSGCALRDIRPDSAKQEISNQARGRGRGMLDGLPEAHGGLDRWRSFETARYEFTDTWQKGIGRAFMPWPASGLRMELAVLQGEDNGRLTFLEGELEGRSWGVQNWVTYIVPADGWPVFQEADDIEFWIPTTTYFFEAPFRLREADVAYALDQKTLGERTFDRVFFSWGTDKPQETTDQYIAWIDRETGRLAYLEYTVRDMMESIKGCMEFADYETFDGITLATKLRNVTEPGGDPILHSYEIHDVEFGADFSRRHVVPRPELSEPKHP